MTCVYGSPLEKRVIGNVQCEVDMIPESEWTNHSGSNEVKIDNIETSHRIVCHQVDQLSVVNGQRVKQRED